MYLALIFVAALAGQFFPGIGAQGSIIAPKAKGAEVVKAVVDQIHRLDIFPDDHKFLCRIAWVESRHGTHRGTYRANYYGGIWQVDEIGYDETVRQPGLRKYWNRIKQRLGIDWTKTTWNDLEKPLYSGLAARLFLARLSAPIPNDLRRQAYYWKTHYNTAAGKGTTQKFIKDIEQATGCAV